MSEDTSNRARAEISKRCKKVTRKIARFCKESGMTKEKIEALEGVFENVSWMKIKLDDARADIGEDGLTVEYDNGGGQQGIRAHPAYKAYEALWKCYNDGLETILKELPKEAKETAEKDAKDTKDDSQNTDPKNVLEMVLGKRKDA